MEHMQIQGAQVPYMPEDKERIYNAGIALFELRAPYKFYFDKTAMGPFNVIVDEIERTRGDPQRVITWVTMMSPGIRYVSDSKGNCIAWMPDDPWWHNRIVLMTDPLLNPVMRHSPKEGLVPASIIRLELQAMRTVLNTSYEKWRVLKDGKRVDDVSSEEEAKDLIEEKKQVSLRLDQASGAMKAVALNRAKYSTEKIFVSDYKKEVREIIRANLGLQNGWTSSEDFQRKYVPLIKREITRLKTEAFPSKSVPGNVSPADLVASMGTWTEKQRAEFRERVLNLTAPTRADQERVAKKAAADLENPPPPAREETVT